jgi:hypothetical protein
MMGAALEAFRLKSSGRMVQASWGISGLKSMWNVLAERVVFGETPAIRRGPANVLYSDEFPASASTPDGRTGPRSH